MDGPFTVYDQRRCRVQLNFEVPREVRKDRVQALAADGQHVAWANHLAQALQECYLEGGNQSEKVALLEPLHVGIILH